MNTGIDLGLKATSIVTINDKGKVIKKVSFGYKFSSDFKITDKFPIKRYGAYAKVLRDYCETTAIGTVIMEDPAGRTYGHALKLWELKGCYITVLKDYVDDDKFFTPKPTKLKKCFTDNGAADKVDMIKECNRRGYKPAHDHEADAIALALMGLEGHVKEL